MELPVRAPFDLEATVRLLQRHPSSPIDGWDGEGYRRALPAGGRDVLCTVRNLGTVDRPRLELTLEPGDVPPAAVATLRATLARMLGLHTEPGFPVDAAGGPALRPLARALRGARAPCFPSLFETICRVVPYQQITVEAGGTIVARLAERFGRRVEGASGSAFAFPGPAEVAAASAAEFAGIGLSTAKLACVRSIAALVAGGALTDGEIGGLPTMEALRRLDALPGIGPWSAALVLLRGFRRMDVFPPGDVGVLRGLAPLVGGATAIAAAVERAGARRGYLYFAPLGARLVERGLIRPSTPGRRRPRRRGARS
jgi:DNA-3-methyladenine glycosylase II